MSSNDPVLVFAPGAWHLPSCFDKIRASLQARGWATEAVKYPSVGAVPPTKHMFEDAAAIRSTINRLANEGKKIILIVHSYGGLAGANAVNGLGYKQRAKEGKPGGITMFVYLAAFVTPIGKSIKDLLNGQFLPWMKFEGDYSSAENPGKVFYHDLSPEDLEVALGQIQHQSGAIFTDAVDYEPWNEIDSAYIICEEDKALPPSVQEQMSTLLGENAYVARIKASHSPFISRTEELTEILEKAAALGDNKIHS